MALVINSPGGSPVQSNLITQLIDSLATKTKIPVMSFAEDVAASGGYWLLCAGQEVYCDPSSIIGSIGVVNGSFGLHALMERIGVERRLLTAGESKARLDPFLPQRADDVAKMEKSLSAIHDVFKEHVRGKRKDKINGNEGKVFSGDFFIGSEGLKLGLVDKIGSLHQVAKEKFGDDVVIRDVSPRPRFPFLPPWIGGGGAGGVSMSACLMDEALTAVEARVEERLWRARVGLE